MKILGIETSCDETAAAVIEGGRGHVSVLSNIVSSQINIHKKYGGVVPEVAAREHVLNILPVIDSALAKAGIKREEIRKKIKAIAVTVGPGLITSLMVGAETAKTLSYVWQIPIIPINHIEGHIYANFINSRIYREFKTNNSESNIKFPALILTVSGGHTMLVLMREHGKYKTIGETRDDAAGEAFDKAAKLLGLGYPGGPAIAAEAARFPISDFRFPNNKKNKSQISLPRPMIDSSNFDFSFSGLKTALLYAIKDDKHWEKNVTEYCYEFQQAIIDVLIHKTIKAAKKFNVNTIMLAGGVAANKELRKQMAKAVKNKILNFKFRIPNLKFCTDNAAMIAAAGYFRAVKKDFTPLPRRSLSKGGWDKIKVDCNLELK